MTEIKIITDIGTIDLSKSVGFGIKISIDDLTNISKKNSSYSKTILVPGTKENNKIFASAYDINTTFTFFNPNRKLNCRLVKDGNVLLDGFIQLLDVKILSNTDQSGNVVQYSIKVSDKIIDFYSSIKKKMLSELDFSESNHTLNRSTVVNSWDNHTYKDNYIYPLLYKGSKDYEIADFTPAIYMKAYLLKIIETAGYSVGGSFLDNLDFEREIVPSNVSEANSMSVTENTRRKFRVGSYQSIVALSEIVGIPGSIQSQPKHYKNFQIDSGLQYYSDEPFFDNDNHWNTGNSSWTADSNGKFSLIGNVPIHIRTIGSPFIYGGADIDIEATIQVNGTNIADVSPPTQTTGFLNASAPQGTESNLFFNIVIDVTAFDIKVGDVIRLVYTFKGEFEGFNYNQTLVQATESNEAWMYNIPEASGLNEFDSVELNLFAPKITQDDIFNDIITRYNLIVRTDPTNNKHIFLDSRDNFYALGLEKGILDWSDKIDRSNQNSIKLLSESQNKELSFSYTQDSDEWNKQFSNRFKEGSVYGERHLNINNDFAKDKSVKKVHTKLAPTPLIYNSNKAEMIVSAILSNDNKKKVRVLHWGGYKPTLNDSGGNIQSWTLTSDANAMTTTHIEYPYFGHFDDPINPTLDLNWGQNIVYQYSEINSSNITDNNLYNRFWRNSVIQIMQGKMFTCKLYLTSNDISYIKTNMNSTIWIDNSYFYISTIFDYNPLDNSSTKVELIKKVDSTQFIGNMPKIDIDYDGAFPGDDDFAVGFDTGLGAGNDNGSGGGMISDVTKTKYTHLWLGDSSPLTGDSGEIRLIKSNNVVTSDMTSVKGLDNRIGSNSKYSSISGDRNRIDNNSKESHIMGGSNNVIQSYSQNSLIMGGDNNTILSNIKSGLIVGTSDKTITTDGEMWIGELHIVNGDIVKTFDIIRGGIDEVQTLFPQSTINVVRGGVDQLAKPFPTNLNNLIRGGYDSL